MAVLRFTHVGVCVSDLERSLHFYRDLLGFQVRSEIDVQGEPAATLLRLPDVALRAVYLERDGMRIELLHYPRPGATGGAEPRPMNARGLTHLSLRVADLADVLATLRAAGVRVLDQTRIDIPAFQAGAVFVCDPDGVLVELIEAPGDPATPPGG